MQNIITNPDGSKIKLEYQTPVNKIKLIYIPSPSEKGKEVEKNVVIKKEV